MKSLISMFTLLTIGLTSGQLQFNGQTTGINPILSPGQQNLPYPMLMDQITSESQQQPQTYTVHSPQVIPPNETPQPTVLLPQFQQTGPTILQYQIQPINEEPYTPNLEAAASENVLQVQQGKQSTGSHYDGSKDQLLSPTEHHKKEQISIGAHLNQELIVSLVSFPLIMLALYCVFNFIFTKQSNHGGWEGNTVEPEGPRPGITFYTQLPTQQGGGHHGNGQNGGHHGWGRSFDLDQLTKFALKAIETVF